MNKISVEDFLKSREKNIPLIDTRTPLEFDQGNIKYAHNLPLLSNEERILIGTIYKQEGKNAAIDAGINVIAPKLGLLRDRIRSDFPQDELSIYCWRGGMRSSSMAWFMELLGKRVYVLIGGYKAYRHYVIEELSTLKLHLIVLGGRTGSGKTNILNSLKNLGEQIIDLEKLADHKGSAFGSIGSKKSVGTEEFENEIFEALRVMDLSKPIWIENESRGVGVAQIPNNIWNQMREATVVHLEIEDNDRLNNLVQDYNPVQRNELVESFEKIRKRLGHENTDQAILFVKEGNLKEAARIALEYYDKTYEFGLRKRSQEKIITVKTDEANPELIAKKIQQLGVK
ncbi:MAG: tRNA 2-selenouridine(34) synthase MnmH [Saprospiraceae bacterium]|nr:tRNA 2-selenouridine(34) synthase MnmH [Saprospiraceae bacterium]